jgi:hypothetical protein
LLFLEFVEFLHLFAFPLGWMCLGGRTERTKKEGKEGGNEGKEEEAGGRRKDEGKKGGKERREEGRGKREEGRGKREEGRGKREEGRGKREREGGGYPWWPARKPSTRSLKGPCAPSCTA